MCINIQQFQVGNFQVICVVSVTPESFFFKTQLFKLSLHYDLTGDNLR